MKIQVKVNSVSAADYQKPAGKPGEKPETARAANVQISTTGDIPGTLQLQRVPLELVATLQVGRLYSLELTPAE